MQTRKEFHQSLQELQKDILKMGTLVEEAIHQAVKALAEMDTALAEKTVMQDDMIDEMTLQVEDRCLRLIALQQPLAGDLRMIGTTLKIVTDLERIADHATDIAKTVLRIAGEKLVKPLDDIPRMAELARAMVREALTAYVERDVERAQKLAAKDDEVDALYTQLFAEVVSLMGKERAVNRQLVHLLMVARYLERVGDHATNLGEWVIFMVNGERQNLNR